MGKCLDHLVEQFPDLKRVLFDKDGKLHRYVHVYVNKESAYPETLAKPVKNGDNLHIVMLIPGG